LNSNPMQSQRWLLWMKTCVSGFETEEGHLKGLSYVSKHPNKVAISTKPKAGMKWLQQVRILKLRIGFPCFCRIFQSFSNHTWRVRLKLRVCHQLRSASNSGSMSFSRISEVVPCLELAHGQGQELEVLLANKGIRELLDPVLS
jgi:hypothetical protein